ncbi:MAG: hypothetical protein ACI4JJ_05810 [Huintestinicola sp.]
MKAKEDCLPFFIVCIDLKGENTGITPHNKASALSVSFTESAFLFAAAKTADRTQI